MLLPAASSRCAMYACSTPAAVGLEVAGPTLLFVYINPARCPHGSACAKDPACMLLPRPHL